jgi:type IV pilus assembly protein PilA
MCLDGTCGSSSQEFCGRENLERRELKIMKKQQGFSLIELLIVVAIILIIAAIAVPNLLRSRMAANEASAAGSERTIATSNVTYSTSYGIGFAPDLSSLGPGAGGGATSAQADLIDSTLGCAAGDCLKSGYVFTYTPEVAAPDTATPNNSYTVVATPSTPNTTGVSYFCVDATNVVRKDPTGAATPTNTNGKDCNGDNTGLYAPL